MRHEVQSAPLSSVMSALPLKAQMIGPWVQKAKATTTETSDLGRA
jgi:hypothetical protein